jgi:hypothetical protein
MLASGPLRVNDRAMMVRTSFPLVVLIALCAAGCGRSTRAKSSDEAGGRERTERSERAEPAARESSGGGERAVRESGGGREHSGHGGH